MKIQLVIKAKIADRLPDFFNFDMVLISNVTFLFITYSFIQQAFFIVEMFLLIATYKVKTWCTFKSIKASAGNINNNKCIVNKIYKGLMTEAAISLKTIVFCHEIFKNMLCNQF